MHVKILRDDVMRQLSLAEKGAWLELMADCTDFERDGYYYAGGRKPRWFATFVAKGVLEPTDLPDTYKIHGADICIETKAALDEKREASRTRKERWRNAGQARDNSNGSLSMSLSPSEGVGLEGSQLQPSRRRDEAYEAFGEWWFGRWQRLPQSARGRINEALAELKHIHRDDGVDIALEIRVRGERARRWQPEWEWTPQTLVKYWPKLVAEVRPPARGKRVDNLLALADRMDSDQR